jgi:hypothetical protein
LALFCAMAAEVRRAGPCDRYTQELHDVTPPGWYVGRAELRAWSPRRSWRSANYPLVTRRSTARSIVPRRCGHRRSWDSSRLNLTLAVVLGLLRAAAIVIGGDGELGQRLGLPTDVLRLVACSELVLLRAGTLSAAV